MKPRSLALLLCLTTITLSSVAAPKNSGEKNSAPDQAYLQKIWDGWSTLDPANVSQYYATGPHTFFDIAPLMYWSWDEYQKNVTLVLADFKSAKFTVDDVGLHPAGNFVWGTAIIKEEMTHKSGKVDMGNFRWTVVFEKQGGKWLIVHEHVSVPMS